MLTFNLLEDRYKVIKIRGKNKDCIVCSGNMFDVKSYDYDEFIGGSCS